MPKMTEFEIKQLDILESIDGKLSQLLETVPLQDAVKAVVEEVSSVSDPHPHLTAAVSCLGLHEESNNEELVSLFKKHNILDFNGNVLDPDALSWCAGGVDLWLVMGGYPKLNTSQAKSFIRYGEEGDGSKGDIFVWGNHVAVGIGKAKAGTGKIITLAEWEEAQDPNGAVEMVIGGNQSDRVNISPKHWYDNYSEFLGYRRPV